MEKVFDLILKSKDIFIVFYNVLSNILIVIENPIHGKNNQNSHYPIRLYNNIEIEIQLEQGDLL